MDANPLDHHRDDGGTADCLRLGMKRVLLTLCQFDLEADDVMSSATLLSPPCVQSTEQDEVHCGRSRYAESHIVIVRFPRHVG